MVESSLYCALLVGFAIGARVSRNVSECYVLALCEYIVTTRTGHDGLLTHPHRRELLEHAFSNKFYWGGNASNNWRMVTYFIDLIYSPPF